MAGLLQQPGEQGSLWQPQRWPTHWRTATVCGGLTAPCCVQEVRKANLPEDSDPTKVTFRVGDACNLPKNLAPVDAVLAANLICRLPEPRKFLDRLPALVKRGGVVVLTTPFSWLEAWTRKSLWLGGCAHSRGRRLPAATHRGAVQGAGWPAHQPQGESKF